MIDTHVHFWQLSRRDYLWIKPENQTLYRDYLLEDVEEYLAKNHISGVIAVQAAHTVDETKYLLELAVKHEQIIGVVGYLDLEASATIKLYEQLRKNPYFVGIRYTLHGFNTDQWEISNQLLENLTIMAKDGFPIDLLMNAGNVPYISRLLEKVPHLKVVVNHLGAPLYHDSFQPWAEGMRNIAEHPKAMCKLSGMISQTKGNQPEIFKKYVAHLIDCFGSDRLLFGSDWPVALLGGNYDEVVHMFREVLPDHLDESQLNNILFENAKRCYRLEDAR
ncbi:amidohydrolase family protein [Bacillaceae bacterium SIJ1]|uniref:amidohydrolase family protein n=1 Tax=Litoribacterium kuwaitense TaxID=1398745 RepID=UPI0013EAC1DF|nr:amidohydrolase family protein [Litoribacterium kuwaitense]NGP44898.1 amidohydrolase family protein [Litoribacterium kuwaitense]